MHAVKADTGAAVWQNADRARGQVFAAPQAAGKHVYFSSGVGVEAVTRADGVLAWRFGIPAGAVDCSPLVLGTSKSGAF